MFLPFHFQRFDVTVKKVNGLNLVVTEVCKCDRPAEGSYEKNTAVWPPKQTTSSKSTEKWNQPVTFEDICTSLAANAIMAKLANQCQQTRPITPSTDKH